MQVVSSVRNEYNSIYYHRILYHVVTPQPVTIIMTEVRVPEQRFTRDNARVVP